MSKRTYAKPESHRAAHKTRALAGVLLAVALIATTVAAKANQAFVAEPLQATNSSSQDKEIRTLELGKPVERELARGQTHTYQIMLAANQYLRVFVKQRGVNVVATLFAPDGQKISEFDNPFEAAQGKEIVLVVAEVSGNYRIEVRPNKPAAALGRYEVSIEELRYANDKDRTQIAIETLMLEAEILRVQNTEAALRKAIKKYEQAIPLCQTIGNLADEGAALNRIGIIYDDFGEKQKALDYYTKAFPLRQAGGDFRGAATTLNNLGVLHQDIGELQKALDYYNQALSIQKQINNQRGVADTLINVGTAYRSLDEWQKALDSYNEALTIYQKINVIGGQGSALNSMAATYRLLGEPTLAVDFYERALPLLREANSPRGEARVLMNRAAAYNDLGEYQKALDSLEQSLKIARTLNDRNLESNALINLCATYFLLGESQKAQDCYEQSLPLMENVNNRRAQSFALAALGKIHYSFGDTQKSQDYLSQALQLMEATGDRDAKARVLYSLARIELMKGNLTQALSHIETAINIIEDIRTNVESKELRAAYFATAQEIYQSKIELLMRLDQQQPAQEFSKQAFQTSERARARSLLELLAESQIDIREGVDTKLLKRERALLQLIRNKNEQSLLSGKFKEAQKAELEKEVRALVVELQQVQSQIRQKSPRYAALTRPEPLALEEIQKQALDEDTLLIEYALGDRQSYAWAVTKDSISSYTLPPRQEIDAIARRVYDSLIARQLQVKESPAQRDARLEKADADFQTSAAELSRLILAPAAEHLGNKRLLIVADGALQYIPFAALPEPVASRQTALGSRPASVSRKHAQSKTPRAKSAVRNPHSAMARPLMLDHEIVSLPSASVMALIRQETAGRTMPEKMAAALADPVFDNDDDRVQPAAQNRLAAAPRDSLAELKLKRTVRAMARAGETLPRLFFTRNEAKAIQALTPSAMIALGFDANRAKAMSAELAQYRYVHFATHGLLNARQPELSGLVFSLLDQAGNRQDGLLGLSEVYNLNLPVEMVVLSACDTARGKEMRGEGLIGLTRGFMYAGAKRVVASLWRVDDATTSELMKRFYQRVIQQGERPAAALRAAQKATWQRLDTRAPYHWAAFVMQGEWR